MSTTTSHRASRSGHHTVYDFGAKGAAVDSSDSTCSMRASKWHMVALLAVVVLLAVFLWHRHCMRMRQPVGYTQSEGYGDVYFNPGLNGDIYTRPTFTSNLDPNNPNLRFDPNASGGYIRGNSPPTGMLAATNTMDTRAGFNSSSMPGASEGFRVTLPSVGLAGGDAASLKQVNDGVLTGGMTDAAAGVSYSDFGQWNAAKVDTGSETGYPGTFQARLTDQVQLGATNVNPVVAPEGSQFEQMGNNFSTLINEVDGTFATKRQSENARFQASLTKKYQTSSQELLDASQMLPVPDMRQASTRDPSDPANYMYDRTLFAKLKPRYGTVADKVRGDLSITPLKTGWFDIATTPSTDLARGYFSSFSDIQQTSDLQDAVYTRDAAAKYGSANDTFTTSINDRVNQITQALAKQAGEKNLAFGVAPALGFGPLQKQYTDQNPWYDSIGQVVNRSFASP
jgi:hypothetical protein